MALLTKFKVGDCVRVVQKYSGFYKCVGCIVIAEKYNPVFPFYAELDTTHGKQIVPFSSNELELAETPFQQFIRETLENGEAEDRG